MSENLQNAFLAVHLGYSSDRVIADPEMNAQFVSECQKSGLTDSPATLNRSLMNLRKRGGLKGIKTTRRTSITNDDEYRFASEMAVRFLERRNQITLDDILCDPVVAVEFDAIAERIAPGYSSLEYRWTALKLRKTRSLTPEQIAHILPSEHVVLLDVGDVDLAGIPKQAGLYVFFTSEQALYVGETENLQRRIGKHLDHSDNKGLARWMWDHGPEGSDLKCIYSQAILTQEYDERWKPN